MMKNLYLKRKHQFYTNRPFLNFMHALNSLFSMRLTEAIPISASAAAMVDLAAVPDLLSFPFVENYIKTKSFSTAESHLDKGLSTLLSTMCIMLEVSIYEAVL